MTYLLYLYIVTWLTTSSLCNPPSPLDVKCATLHCAKSFAACTGDKSCRENFACAAKCWGKWDTDKTPQKTEVQNCTSMCTFTYETAVYDNVMECLSENNCLKFPPIASSCKGPGNIKMQKNVSLPEIQGGWWVLRGYNPVYDCYPCQKNYFQQADSNWVYRADYQVYLTNGTLKLISQSGQAATNFPEPGFNVSFIDAGLMNNESWWVFDRIEASSGTAYYLAYYCGNVLQWNFEGAIIYSQSATLEQSVISTVANSYKVNIGLDFSTFCSPTVAGCPDLI